MVERYVIRGGRAGADRLQVLARQWASTTSALLDHVGVRPGALCLDLGCGAGDVTLELAGRVGPEGRVAAVDMDVVQLDVTRERTDAAGLGNVDVVLADVYQYRSSVSFDLVYCRNLLQHLSRPVEMLRSMWAAVRPGGAIVVEDCDFEGSFCYPPNDGFEFWLTRYQRVLRRYGGDPLSGRKLPARFAAAGIPPPQIRVVQRVGLTGDGKTMPMLTVQATAAAMLEAGIATEQEIAAAVDQLRVFADDDSALHGSPRLFQAWTRRTAQGG
jgi:SAM-dependent methyltransferase